MRSFWLSLLLLPAIARADFAIRDGDTVVFLGDSITAERTYGKIIESYTLLRFPQRKVRFINAGWGGDTAARGLARLQRDVFDKGATLLTVAYGINDIGWGGKADAEHRQLYLDSIRGIVQACKQHDVRVFICSAAATGSDPDEAADDFLQKMCDNGMEISRDAGEGTIDVLRTMRQIQRRIKAANEDVKKTLHADDGIHLNETGQVAMAYAILKGLGAPAVVSSATIDGRNARSTAADGCEITDIIARDGGIEFDRLDQGLPFNRGLFFNLRYRCISLPEDMNRYMLTITDLASGKYDIEVDGRALGMFTNEQLTKGVNLASATADPWTPGGPWDAQAWALNYLTEARNQAVMVDRLQHEYLKTNRNRDAVIKQVEELNARLEEAQRAVAKPQKYHFVISPVKSPKPATAPSAR